MSQVTQVTDICHSEFCQSCRQNKEPSSLRHWGLGSISVFCSECLDIILSLDYLNNKYYWIAIPPVEGDIYKRVSVKLILSEDD